MLGERGGEIEIDRLICWEDKERDRYRQAYVRGDGREIKIDRLICWRAQGERTETDRHMLGEMGGR